MSEQQALLFNNDVFYQAFAARDLEAIDAIWAVDAPVACLHPGWTPLFERSDIIQSFAAIFDGPSPPDIKCLGARALLYGAVGVVICYEALDENYLAATNVFVRRDSKWVMVHHQAGPTEEPSEEIRETPQNPIN